MHPFEGARVERLRAERHAIDTRVSPRAGCVGGHVVRIRLHRRLSIGDETKAVTKRSHQRGDAAWAEPRWSATAEVDCVEGPCFRRANGKAEVDLGGERAHELVDRHVTS